MTEENKEISVDSSKKKKEERGDNTKKHPLEKETTGWWGFFVNILDTVVFIAVIILIRLFVFSPFSVEGSSMNNTYADKDKIFVDRLTYRFTEPKRGDVIVFHPPVPTKSKLPAPICFLTKYTTALFSDKKDPCITESFYIKRVIGIPGDVIEIQKGRVFLTPKDGVRTEIATDFLTPFNQDRTCFSSPSCQDKRDIRGKVYDPVPEGHVFVLGDNRTGSMDSRAWIDPKTKKILPFVPYENIDGISRITYFPLSHFKFSPSVSLF